MVNRTFLLLKVIMAIAVCLLGAKESVADKPKILVVMSYEENFPWCREIREGIDSILSDSHEIRYFYMDTKINLAGGTEKASQAWELFQDIKPVGVIAADDNAQSMFVVPYLKDRVTTPVMFCGVNAEPEQYGYPASNVSGILERLHIAESIAFAQQLMPTITSFSFITKKGPVSQLLLNQIEKEKEDYTVEFVDFVMPANKQEAIAMAAAQKESSDLLFMETLQGISDEQGRSMEEREIMPLVARAFGKPIIGSNKYAVQYAALCAVVKTGQEQGSSAAMMLLEAMNGKPVEQLPIITNRYGKRIINVAVMKELGITPRPIMLQGVELIRKVQ